MNAYEIPDLRYSLPAGEDIPRRRFVSVNSSSEGVLATAAGSIIGVSMNEADDGEVLEIADGIVMVEAEDVIAAGADIQVGTDGKAITKTTGVGVGIAITGAADAGQPLAVKLVSMSAADGADGADAPLLHTILYTSTDLAAGADLTDVAIGVIPAGYDGTVLSVQVISTGSASGVDASNTSVFLLEVGTTEIAGVTFDDVTAFPAANVAQAMTIALATVSASDVLALSVTNGDTADLPIFIVQVTLSLEPTV